MIHRLDFDATTLTSVTGGQSVIDLPRLAIHTEAQAHSFIAAYGFHLDNPKDVSRLRYFYRRALVLLEEKLGFSTEEMPEVLRERKNFEDLSQLLLWASSVDPSEKQLQRWSCAILRAIHVFVHAESDLFGSFSEEIQRQILSPIQERIFTEGTTGTTYLKVPAAGKANVLHEDEIALAGFEIKAFKSSASTVIKLLAKPDAIAMRVFDRLGVRFVTKSLLDTFRVIRFLMEHNLVSYPHIMPDQSSNNLYPADLFCQICADLSAIRADWTEEELESEFHKKLEENRDKISWLRKENSFSAGDYQFIKFIARKLIRIPMGEGREEFAFFFPYEVQILDSHSFERIQSGPSHHQQYKDRQKIAAKIRLFPDLKAELTAEIGIEK